MCSKQNVVVNNSASTMKNIITRVLEDSIYGPLLFNSFIHDLASFIQYMQLDNNLDHNNLFVTGSNIKDLKKNTAGRLWDSYRMVFFDN